MKQDPASLSNTTTCREPSRGGDALRTHPRRSQGSSMHYAGYELRRIPRMRTSPYHQNADFAVTEFSEGVIKRYLGPWESQQKPTSRLRENIGGFSRLIGARRKDGDGCPNNPTIGFQLGLRARRSG